MENEQLSIEELEKRKLLLEVTELEKPWYRKAQNLFSFFGLILAIGGVLIQNQVTDFKIAQNEQDVAVESEFLQDKAESLRQKEGREPLAEDKLITDVWAYNVSGSTVNEAREYLISKGYEVGFGGLVGSRPSWLALRPTVFYYDKESKGTAETIASELNRELNLSFKIQRGAGLGVKDSEKSRTFFIHIVK